MLLLPVRQNARVGTGVTTKQRHILVVILAAAVVAIEAADGIVLYWQAAWFSTRCWTGLVRPTLLVG